MRRVCAGALVMFGVALGSVGVVNPVAAAQPTQPAQPAQPTTSAVSNFGACLAAQRRGDLLLMIDESSSLQSSDPDAARVSAANYLLERLNSFGASAGVNLQVAVAGFADMYTVHTGWTGLDAHSLPTLQGSVDSFRNRTQGIDTDYRIALDGARHTLAERGRGVDGANPCQAVAWFTDGKLDFTARDAQKPYAPNLSLTTDAGVQQVIGAARESICRPAGVADQLRSSGIATFAVGLAVAGTAESADFDLMKSIATGEPAAGTPCGSITSPRPGDFYLAQNIDDLLFAFDALSTPGQAPLHRESGVCVAHVCEEGKHRFVLDNSISAVTVLGSADAEGLVPTLVSPRGDELPMDHRGAPVTASVGGVDVTYRWQSSKSVSFTMDNADAAQWQGVWALVFVDPTGAAPSARSKSNIHISGNLFPAWLGQDTTKIHSGEKTSAIQLGIVDARREPVDPSALLGSAALSVSVIDQDRTEHHVAKRIPKDRIGEPIELDLTDISPGTVTLRLTLEVTTADAPLAGGGVEPGTVLTPQSVDVPLSIAPPIGYPTLPSRIDFGTLEGPGRFTTELTVDGPGCVWLDPAAPVTLAAAPDGVGRLGLTTPAAATVDSCLTVADGERATLPVTIDVGSAANGVVNGSIQLSIAPVGESDRALPVDVPFTAEVQKPLDSGKFWVTLIAALILGPGVPLLLLYLAKWLTARIPARTLKAEQFRVTVSNGTVLRDGNPFQLRERDLIESVRGLDRPARRLIVDGIELRTHVGRSPFGAGYVTVHAPGLVGASGFTPATERGNARLPLAVHNTWCVLHNPAGPAESATLVLLVGGESGPEHRQALVDDMNRRLPAVLATLRTTATRHTAATRRDDGAAPTAATPQHAALFDPFGGPQSGGAAPQGDPFGGPQSAAPAPPGDPFAWPPQPQGSGLTPPDGHGSVPSRGDFDPFAPPDRRT